VLKVTVERGLLFKHGLEIGGIRDPALSVAIYEWLLFSVYEIILC